MVKCWNGEIAMSALLASPIAAPTHVAVSDNLDFLDLTTAHGDEVRLPAGRLRAACKCAHCIRARIDGKFPDQFDGIAITQVSPIGDYAINIAFSDGHARGIYPWSYLSELVVV
jgi:prepilin-type processing-associated H-X9-DG protein